MAFVLFSCVTYMLALYQVNASSMIYPIFFWSSHALDLVLLVVTNRSTRDAHLESWFVLHIDTNYCGCGSFTKYLNMSMFPLYVSHVHVQIWWYHALDSVLLVVTNQFMRDTCLESRFGHHMDMNYCVHENFIKCLNISLCLSYMRHIFMFKLNHAMPLIWSCWWLQIGLWEEFVSSPNSAPTKIQIIVCMKIFI
jgi:hypothetical protein